MKARHKRATGGRDDADADVKTKNMRYTADSNVNREAEEKKRGGSAKGESAKKHVGKVNGDTAAARADRKPRKSGGAASNENPFSSARAGKAAPGRNVQMSD